MGVGSGRVGGEVVDKETADSIGVEVDAVGMERGIRFDVGAIAVHVERSIGLQVVAEDARGILGLLDDFGRTAHTDSRPGHEDLSGLLDL